MAKKSKYFKEDREAMRIADRYGLTYEYKLSRRHNLTPQEALEDWDLLSCPDKPTNAVELMNENNG